MENGKSGLRAKLPGGLNTGIPGRGIASIVRTGGSGASGTDDTYTITYTDGTTSTFTVHNGADGKTAYQYAVDGGYTGSEEDFAKQLAGGGNGGGYTLPVATAEKLGGVKAVAATEEMTEEVGIDAEGKLKVKPGGGSDVAWFNVKDYGAKGDGVTNDAPAIRAAIEALPESNFVLYFPPGVYMQGDGTNPHYPLDDKGHYSGDNEIGEPIYFRFEKKSNFQILGFGAVIQAHPDNSCIINNRGFDFDMCNDGTIAGLTYNGSIETRKPGGGDNGLYNNQSAFAMFGCKNLTFYRVNAIGAVMDGFNPGWSREYVGAPLITSDYIKLDGCKALYSYRQGMSVVGGHHGVARDCDFSHTATIYGTSPRDGVDLEDPDAGGEDGWLFSGCRFENNAGTGIACSAGARNTVIDSCYFSGSGAYVGQYAEEGTIIKNCLFENANITLENYCTFEGNYLRSDSANTFTCAENLVNDNIAQHVRNNTFHWNWDVAAEDFSSGYAATDRGVSLIQPNMWFEDNTLLNPSGSGMIYAPHGMKSFCRNRIVSDYDMSAHSNAYIGEVSNQFNAEENEGNSFKGKYKMRDGIECNLLNRNLPVVICTKQHPTGNGNIVEFTLCKTDAFFGNQEFQVKVFYQGEIVKLYRYNSGGGTTKTRLASNGNQNELLFSDIYEENGYFKLLLKKATVNIFHIRIELSLLDGGGIPVEEDTSSYTVRAATEADDTHNFTNPPVYTVDGAGNVEILV